MFSLKGYEDVAHAYIAGLEKRAECNEDISRITSVASFFVSRIDAMVEKQLPETSSLWGKIAIDNAKLAYHRFQQIFHDTPKCLQEKGAQVQRPLWSSTSTKNPNYSDVLYIEELIGADTVNTIPPATLDAFKDHGQTRLSVIEGVDLAQQNIDSLKTSGIDFQGITTQLKTAGVNSFAKSFDSLIETLSAKRDNVLATFSSQTEIVQLNLYFWTNHSNKK